MKAIIITKISKITDIKRDLLSLIAEISFHKLIPTAIKNRVKAPKVDE